MTLIAKKAGTFGLPHTVMFYGIKMAAYIQNRQDLLHFDGFFDGDLMIQAPVFRVPKYCIWRQN